MVGYDIIRGSDLGFIVDITEAAILVEAHGGATDFDRAGTSLLHWIEAEGEAPRAGFLKTLVTEDGAVEEGIPQHVDFRFAHGILKRQALGDVARSRKCGECGGYDPGRDRAIGDGSFGRGFASSVSLF